MGKPDWKTLVCIGVGCFLSVSILATGKWELKGRQCIAERALYYVGLKELTGNNDHPKIKKWLKRCNIKTPAAWCTAFACNMFYECGMDVTMTASVNVWFSRNVIWYREWGENPHKIVAGMAGKMRGYSHTILLIGEDAKNYYYVAGNESNRVVKGMIPKSKIEMINDKYLKGDSFLEQYGAYLKKHVK